MNVRYLFIAGVVAAIAAGLSWPARAAQSACDSIAFPAYGHYVRSDRLHGPGLLLGGGGASEVPPAAFAWLHRRLTGQSTGRGGNVVVLRASGSNLYDKPFVQYGNFASVRDVFIPPCASRAQIDRFADVVDTADAVFFAGGDQSHYVVWKGSQLMDAVKRVYARGGVVGGGSAGLAIQGAVIYDSAAADRLDVETHTADAVASPLEERISFTTGLFSWPALSDTITDTHLAVRDRFGRMVVFLARIKYSNLLPGAKTVYALGIDQASAVVVDPDGSATVFNGPGGRGAFLVRAVARPQLEPGQPFRYTIELSHVAGNGERFDLLRKTTSDAWHALTVDGARTPVYSRDPYQR